MARKIPKYKSYVYWSWKNPVGSLRRIWQNLTRGWNDSDCWSLDRTITLFTLPRLIRLKEIQHGIPMLDIDNNGVEIPKDSPIYDFGPPDSDKEDTRFKAQCDEWALIMDRMIRAFTLLALGDEAYQCPEIDMWTTPAEDGKSSYIHTKPKDQAAYDEYKEFMKKAQEEIKLGLKLFAHYYQGLWD